MLKEEPVPTPSLRRPRPAVGRSADRSGRGPALTRRQAVGLVLGAVVFLIPLLVDVPSLEDMGERMLAVFGLAIVLWVTEAIPLVATAVLVIALEILLISNQALLPVPGDATK